MNLTMILRGVPKNGTMGHISCFMRGGLYIVSYFYTTIRLILWESIGNYMKLNIRFLFLKLRLIRICLKVEIKLTVMYVVFSY